MRRREQNYDIWGEENSLYRYDDLKSKFYKGNWVKAWLGYCYDEAYKTGKNVYDVMCDIALEKHEHMPEKLYKFFPFNENSLKCLELNSIYLNSPEQFNDPYDCRISTNKDEFMKKYLLEYIVRTDAVARGVLTEDEYNELRASMCEEKGQSFVKKSFDSVWFHIQYRGGLINKHNRELNIAYSQASEQYNKSIEALRNQNIRVSCLANMDNDYILKAMEMWGHYAQSHQGFCVEYGLKNHIDDYLYKMQQGWLFPCIYTSKSVNVSKEHFYKYAMNLPMSNAQEKRFNKSILLSFLTKSSSWSYEKEWRIIVPAVMCEYYDNMIPFFPISKIFLGCRMKKDNREYLYRFAQQKSIPISEMHMVDTLFELEEHRVDVKDYFTLKKLHKQVVLDKKTSTGFNLVQKFE